MAVSKESTPLVSLDFGGGVRLSNKEAIILDQLAGKSEMFGLEMVQTDPTNLKRGTIYVTLNRLEEKGFIKSRKIERDEKSNYPRRLYQITGLGQRVLAARQAASTAMLGAAT